MLGELIPILAVLATAAIVIQPGRIASDPAERADGQIESLR